MERRLAAVLIADVVGYDRLSQIDEEGTRDPRTAPTSMQTGPVFTVLCLYQLVRQGDAVKDRTFEINFLDSGVQAFAFTFG